MTRRHRSRSRQIAALPIVPSFQREAGWIARSYQRSPDFRAERSPRKSPRRDSRLGFPAFDSASWAERPIANAAKQEQRHLRRGPPLWHRNLRATLPRRRCGGWPFVWEGQHEDDEGPGDLPRPVRRRRGAVQQPRQRSPAGPPGLGYKGVQIPTWDARLFDLEKAADVEGPIATRSTGICREARRRDHRAVDPSAGPARRRAPGL